MNSPSQRPSSNRLSEAPSSAGWGRRDSQTAMAQLVQAEDLSVVFQPIVSLDDGSVFAFEALVRCRVPALASPPRLFENALSAGCVGRLGRMIREAAMPLSESHKLFVNVHPQELHEQWLIRPDDPLYFHDAEVFLEVTEAVPLQHPELCRTVLAEVRARGVHIVVDDLGAGYSNLRSIADVEPRVVKLDRGLVEGIAQRPRQRRLVTAVVRLCRDLGADVVVEGIETAEELSAIIDTGAHYGQGYLFARPAFPPPAPVWPLGGEARPTQRAAVDHGPRTRRPPPGQARR